MNVILYSIYYVHVCCWWLVVEVFLSFGEGKNAFIQRGKSHYPIAVVSLSLLPIVGRDFRKHFPLFQSHQSNCYYIVSMRGCFACCEIGFKYLECVVNYLWSLPNKHKLLWVSMTFVLSLFVFWRIADGLMWNEEVI